MEVILAPGDIMHTDYFSSADYHAGLAWLTVRLHDWHVLLPRGCSPVPKIATIRPVTDHEEPDGWRWRLELGDWHLPIKHRQIVGRHPRLPSPGTQLDRILRLYVRKAFHAHRHAEHHANPVPQPHAVLGLRVVRESSADDKTTTPPSARCHPPPREEPSAFASAALKARFIPACGFNRRTTEGREPASAVSASHGGRSPMMAPRASRA